jgi:hypothetical protein
MNVLVLFFFKKAKREKVKGGESGHISNLDTDTQVHFKVIQV